LKINSIPVRMNDNRTNKLTRISSPSRLGCLKFNCPEKIINLIKQKPELKSGLSILTSLRVKRHKQSNNPTNVITIENSKLSGTINNSHSQEGIYGRNLSNDISLQIKKMMTE
jgi:hypothetical protein